jgi:hypothetical protein
MGGLRINAKQRWITELHKDDRMAGSKGDGDEDRAGG